MSFERRVAELPMWRSHAKARQAASAVDRLAITVT